MKKYALMTVGLLILCAVSSGCRSSSASSCWTRNGSRVPYQAANSAPANAYPMEDVIYAAPTSAPSYASINPCVPNACVPNACDPCAATCAPNCAGTSSSGYSHGVLPGM